MARLPRKFRDKIANVVVVVEDWPDDDTLDEMGIEPPDTLYGLYRGVDLTHRDSGYGNVLPDTVRRALWPQLGMHAPTLARPRPHHQIVQDLLRSGDTAGFGRDALKRILPRR